MPRQQRWVSLFLFLGSGPLPRGVAAEKLQGYVLQGMTLSTAWSSVICKLKHGDEVGQFGAVGLVFRQGLRLDQICG